MARSRLPQAKAEASGAALKNPGRFKNRKAPKARRPIGAPYVTMTEDEAAVWVELTGELPWLHSAHRVLLRMACQLTAKMARGELGVTGMPVLSSILSKLGATPVDETKVTHGDDEDSDEEFDFGRPN